MSCEKNSNRLAAAATKNGIAKSASQQTYLNGPKGWTEFKEKYRQALAKNVAQVEISEATPGTTLTYKQADRHTKLVAVDRNKPDTWPEWVQGKKLGITPLYANLFIPETEGDILWIGTKNSRYGRQRRHVEYTPGLKAARQRQKWQRVEQLKTHLPAIMPQIRSDAAHGNEVALALLAVSQLGIRVDVSGQGKRGQLGLDQRFGATSLQSRHIKFVPNNPNLIKIEFPGKGTLHQPKINLRYLSNKPADDRTPHLAVIQRCLHKLEAGEVLTKEEQHDVAQAYKMLNKARAAIYDPQLFAFFEERRKRLGATRKQVFEDVGYKQLLKYTKTVTQACQAPITPHNFRHLACSSFFDNLCQAAAVKDHQKPMTPLEFKAKLHGSKKERRRAKRNGAQAGILGQAADFINDTAQQTAASYINPRSTALQKLRKHVQPQAGWLWNPKRLIYTASQ